MEQAKNMESQQHQQVNQPVAKPNEQGSVSVQGHIKIFDPKTQEVFVNKRNAIHYENFSLALARSLSNQGEGTIAEMVFGNGGTRVDETGVITYLPPNTTGQNADLYNQTYAKVVDDNSAADTDPQANKMTVLHTSGTVYTDILVSCLLDYGEPSGQAAFDNDTTLNGTYTFDELALFGRSTDGTTGITTTAPMLTHVIFHPVQKSLNRLIQVNYTVRIQTLTNLSSIG